MKNVNKAITGVALVALVVSLGAVFAARSTTPAPASTVSLSTTSSTTSTTANYLYFTVSCDNCTVGDTPNISKYFPGENGTTAGRSQYAGTYDVSVLTTTSLFGNAIYGNGTQTFQVQLPYQGSLHDWYFQQMTADGTMRVSLQWSNGTQVWQGSTNSTVDYVGGP
jgi:hypothetical protein